MTAACFADFEKARRSVYLPKHHIENTLNAYLDLSPEDFGERIREKIAARFETELKAFCCVRDTLVLSTFFAAFQDKEQVRQFADHLVEQEEDYDLRMLRVNLFNRMIQVH